MGTGGRTGWAGRARQARPRAAAPGWDGSGAQGISKGATATAAGRAPLIFSPAMASASALLLLPAMLLLLLTVHEGSRAVPAS